MGARKPGVPWLTSPSSTHRCACLTPQPGSHAAAVLRPRQHRLSPPSHSVRPCTALGGSVGQSRLPTGPREGGAVPWATQPASGLRGAEGGGEGRNQCIPVWAGLRVGGGPGGSSPSSFPMEPTSSVPASLLPRLPVQGAPPPSSPYGSARFLLRSCHPPSPTPALPACLPAAPSPSLDPWLWPRRAWRGSQAPHRSGQSSGQSQSVWQGCEFRIGWRCPAFGRRELWGEADGWVAHSRSPSFPLPASLFNSCPFCLTLRREEARCLTGRRQRSPGMRKAFGAPGVYSSANTECRACSMPGPENFAATSTVDSPCLQPSEETDKT